MAKILTSFLGIFSCMALCLFNAPGTYAATSIPVLEYHYIRNYTQKDDQLGHNLSVSLSNFDAQMNYLKANGYTPISLDAAAAIVGGKTSGPTKPVVLTFDDGTVDFYTNAFPILQKYNFQATSFVITSFVGKPPFITWENIHRMAASNLVYFESHTVNHKSLSSLNLSQLSYELKESKRILQEETGKIVNFIAYPFGHSNKLVWNEVQKAGYNGGFGEQFGFMKGTTMDLPRVRVNGGESLKAFASRL